MVGPSVTQADREKFLVRLKVGFALLVGVSMALVTLWGGAALWLVLAVGVGTTLVGGLLAEYTIPDSIAETPLDDTRERGPKPGTRMQERRERADSEQDRAVNRDRRQ
jgi:hypothetical protein